MCKYTNQTSNVRFIINDTFYTHKQSPTHVYKSMDYTGYTVPWGKKRRYLIPNYYRK